MKDDLISRQDAIEALIHEFYSNVDDYISERQAVHAIEKLPSAQPNLQPTCNQLATDVISRQEAIDAAVEAADEWDGGYSRSREEIITLKLRMLPSAQPEIIRCRDCKYFAGEGMYCGQNICVQFDHFYCYYGERKE